MLSEPQCPSKEGHLEPRLVVHSVAPQAASDSSKHNSHSSRRARSEPLRLEASVPPVVHSAPPPLVALGSRSSLKEAHSGTPVRRLEASALLHLLLVGSVALPAALDRLLAPLERRADSGALVRRLAALVSPLVALLEASAELLEASASLLVGASAPQVLEQRAHLVRQVQVASELPLALGQPPALEVKVALAASQ